MICSVCSLLVAFIPVAHCTDVDGRGCTVLYGRGGHCVHQRWLTSSQCRTIVASITYAVGGYNVTHLTGWEKKEIHVAKDWLSHVNTVLQPKDATIYYWRAPLSGNNDAVPLTIGIIYFIVSLSLTVWGRLLSAEGTYIVSHHYILYRHTINIMLDVRKKACNHEDSLKYVNAYILSDH